MNMLAAKTQTCNELSMDYNETAVGSTDGLSVTVAQKSMKTESECYQQVGSLRQRYSFDLLKVELKDK